MIIFNCTPESVTAYSISKMTVYEIDQKVDNWTIDIWWADGRESSLVLRDPKDVEVIQNKLERTVREPPATAGF